MAAPERHPYRCPLLLDVLRLLPVHPLRERDVLGLARFRARRAGWGVVHGVRLASGDLEELFLDQDGGHPRVSREGARLLLDLYQKGVLEASPTRDADGGVELLEAYADGRASIVSPAFLPRSGRRKSRSIAQRPPHAAPAHSKPDAPVQATRPGIDPSYRMTVHRLLD